MITPDLTPAQRQPSLKKVARRKIDRNHGLPAVPIQCSHPLFPPDQAFLWLPGLPGDQLAYCTHNEVPEYRWLSRKPDRDQNQALHAPPYRVSTETFIAWHTNVTPPFPFHPIPIARTLGAVELAELGRRVRRLGNENTDRDRDPHQILRNNRKCFVLAALAEMGLLAGKVPHPC